MKYSREEILQYVAEEDVKFIRLAFCDVRGRQKNISVMPGELERALDGGIAIDASAIAGFGGEVRSDLLRRPDPATLAPLPWRPEHGRVVRLFCTLENPDGSPCQADTRALLAQAVADAQAQGLEFSFGAEMEFYLFRRDEEGKPTGIPFDSAGYMDVAPEDRGENVRREICLTLEQMGIRPESSHHEEGPGQNEIDFRYADPLTAADQAVTFRSVVQTIAARNGLYADFSPKPLPDKPGNGMHINLSAAYTLLSGRAGEDVLPRLIAGVLYRAAEMTPVLNPSEASYRRFGSCKAPRYISWSAQNRSQLIRVPAAVGAYRRAELRSPDPDCNPYLAYTMLIRAGLESIRLGLPLPAPVDCNLYTAPAELTAGLARLPGSLADAKAAARTGDFLADCLPEPVRAFYLS
ncbi:MAG: glutamine synthetase family protein [Oscillospiraceae bacterium]|nr:MAG: glutamine synthetase family protein [Oscillospiraceae bacterium]